MRFLFALSLTTAVVAQGIPGTGEKPCCYCDAPTGEVVCRALDKGEECIVTTAKCLIDEEEEKYCCCCNPGRAAIVCSPKPKGDGCLCPAVVCNIPWEPEWAETWIPDL